jgi:hypothetical protein
MEGAFTADLRSVWGLSCGADCNAAAAAARAGCPGSGGVSVQCTTIIEATTMDCASINHRHRAEQGGHEHVAERVVDLLPDPAESPRFEVVRSA